MFLMDRKRLFASVVALMITIYGLQLLAERLYWYDKYWWFDIPMHFLGGFWVAIFFFWFFGWARVPFLRRPVTALNREAIVSAWLFLLLVGLTWEAGEFLTTNYIGLDPWSARDTILDVILDVAGAAAGIIYGVRLKAMQLSRNKIQSS